MTNTSESLEKQKQILRCIKNSHTYSVKMSDIDLLVSSGCVHLPQNISMHFPNTLSGCMWSVLISFSMLSKGLTCKYLLHFNVV